MFCNTRSTSISRTMILSQMTNPRLLSMCPALLCGGSHSVVHNITYISVFNFNLYYNPLPECHSLALWTVIILLDVITNNNSSLGQCYAIWCRCIVNWSPWVGQVGIMLKRNVPPFSEYRCWINEIKRHWAFPMCKQPRGQWGVSALMPLWLWRG